MITGDHNDLEGQDPLESASSNSNGHGGRSFGMKVNDAQFSLILVLATSFVLLIAVTTFEGSIESRGYAIAVPALSLTITLIALLLTVFKESIYNSYGTHITKLLFMWNFTGACFLTFGSPFTVTGNGYFAAWACVVVSAMAMGLNGDNFRSRIEGLGSLLGLGCSSILVIIALLDYLGSGPSTYALIVSIFTVVFVVGVTLAEKKYSVFTKTKMYLRVKFGLLIFFAFLWLILACLVTFKEPFTSTGNGYFASWAGMACSFFAAFSAWNELGISTEDLVGFLTPGSNSDGRTGLSATVT
jgi:hypothetical protein